MNFKKHSLPLICLSILTLFLISCDGRTKESMAENSVSIQPEGTTPKPLNLSVFIDLSDRVVRTLVPSQMERDTAIINCLIDHFVVGCVNQKIVPSKDRIRVLFYPTPSNGAIVNWAANLEVDMSTLKPAQKRQELLDMKKNFNESLCNIYDHVLNTQDWVGCDIWDFFSSKKVDVQCIKQGYRNVLVILTDGYLYYTPNKVKEGNAYSYVLPQTLKVPNSSLIVKRNGLEDLEVLMLEVNPYSPTQTERLMDVLETWFTQMGVTKVSIVETDILSNVKPYIDAFL